MSTNTNNTTEKSANRTLLFTMGIIIFAAVVIAIIGFVFMNAPTAILKGR